MQWLTKLVDEIVAKYPEGDILISSGGSPSGTHHLGHLRELIICDAVSIELNKRDRQANHIYFVDDLDALRKIPANLPESYSKYLGQSLCDIPAPDGEGSYADYFIKGLENSAKNLGIKVSFVRAHNKYREGFFVPAIETAMEKIDEIRTSLETISGHKLGEEWSPIQINEEGYLKKRIFVSLDKASKKITYLDKDGQEAEVNYSEGDVKLDWRIDWPARWALLGVKVEPFGRDHSTKGGSYDTGADIIKKVFDSEPPYPVAYDFINMAGDTKKMSASKGTGLDAESVTNILPPEIIRYFILSVPPSKRLYFDPQNGVSKLVDDFSRLLLEDPNNPTLYFSRQGVENLVISCVPFSLLVESYQASLKDVGQTIEIIKRTEYKDRVEANQIIIKEELGYIDNWLENWAPDDVKFELVEQIDRNSFNETDIKVLLSLAEKLEQLGDKADGEEFHKAIYEVKDELQIMPKALFAVLYKVLINKESGPRAGWFLSILPRDWLIKRLKLEV